MRKRPLTVVFLDVDGFISMHNPADHNERFEMWGGLPAFPIPIVNQLLRGLDTDPALLPVWMTCWDSRAWKWNERAGTRTFPVAYYLSPRQISRAKRLYPDLAYKGYDDKLLAAAYFLRKYPNVGVVWLEDGFAWETAIYAEVKGWKLIDVTVEPLPTILRHPWAYPDFAADSFIRHFIKGEQSEYKGIGFATDYQGYLAEILR